MRVQRAGWLLLALVVLAGIGGGVAAMAPALPTVDWWVISGGEGPRSGGTLEVTATIGQPVVGAGAGGGLSLSSGYWAMAPQPAALQERYLPLLVRGGG